MFLQAVSAVSPSSLQGVGVATASGLAPLFNNSACTSTIFNSLSPASLSFSSSPSTNRQKAFKVFAASDETSSLSLTGVIFQPFEEVKNEEFAVPVSPNTSLARQRHSENCVVAINEQINVDYSVSYAYHAMYAYFDRDNIALKGLAKYFKKSSDKERERAEKLMKYLNIRGGRVQLFPLKEPPSEYEHMEKGDALFAMELALSLEKVTNEKLLNVQNVAERENDPQMADFIESEFLGQQVVTIKKISEYVTQLRMVGKGHGVWHFDQKLLHEGEDVH